jgi:DNA-binding response OmpR family regulator
VVPRVLMVQRGPELDNAEPVVAGDGDSALTLLRHERFDAVILDLGLAPLDGWCVLATVGTWVERPRLVAIVSDDDHVGRALVLGADLCVPPGTPVDARALFCSTTQNPKELECPQPLPPTFPSPTTSGVRA